MVITFLPRSKHLLISWLQSPSAVILELRKIKLYWNCMSKQLPKHLSFPLSLNNDKDLLGVEILIIKTVHGINIYLCYLRTSVTICYTQTLHLYNSMYIVVSRNLNMYPKYSIIKCQNIKHLLKLNTNTHRHLKVFFNFNQKMWKFKYSLL